VHATLDLLIDGEHGIWHLVNDGAVSWAELARMAARAAELDESLVRARPHTQMGLIARRPAKVPLRSERGWIMPSLEHAIARYLRERSLVRPLEDDDLVMTGQDAVLD
jgi:dTDP-4-dehydrorhamnose reductase